MIVRLLCSLNKNGLSAGSPSSSYGFALLGRARSVNVYCWWRWLRESTLDLIGAMIWSMNRRYLRADDASRVVVMTIWLCSRNMGFE